MKQISTQKRNEKSVLEENCMGYTVYLLLVLKPFNQPSKNTVSLVLFVSFSFLFYFIHFILFSWGLRIFKGRVSERLRPNIWKKRITEVFIYPLPNATLTYFR